MRKSNERAYLFYELQSVTWMKKEDFNCDEDPDYSFRGKHLMTKDNYFVNETINLMMQCDMYTFVMIK